MNTNRAGWAILWLKSRELIHGHCSTCKCRRKVKGGTGAIVSIVVTANGLIVKRLDQQPRRLSLDDWIKARHKAVLSSGHGAYWLEQPLFRPRERPANNVPLADTDSLIHSVTHILDVIFSALNVKQHSSINKNVNWMMAPCTNNGRSAPEAPYQLQSAESSVQFNDLISV